MKTHICYGYICLQIIKLVSCQRLPYINEAGLISFLLAEIQCASQTTLERGENARAWVPPPSMLNVLVIPTA